MQQHKQFKLAIVAAGLKNQQVADRANERLPPHERLTEQAITRIITGRRRPSALQQEALSRVLERPVTELFDA